MGGEIEGGEEEGEEGYLGDNSPRQLLLFMKNMLNFIDV